MCCPENPGQAREEVPHQPGLRQIRLQHKVTDADDSGAGGQAESQGKQSREQDRQQQDLCRLSVLQHYHDPPGEKYIDIHPQLPDVSSGRSSQEGREYRGQRAPPRGSEGSSRNARERKVCGHGTAGGRKSEQDHAQEGAAHSAGLRRSEQQSRDPAADERLLQGPESKKRKIRLRQPIYKPA